MMPASPSNDRPLLWTGAALLLATLLVDVFVQVGGSAWILYFLPIGLAVFQSRPALPLGFAGAATVLSGLVGVLSPTLPAASLSLADRTMGAAGHWVLALVVWQVLQARHDFAVQHAWK